MSSNEICDQWMNFDEDVKSELEGLSLSEIEDRFYRDIEFGTGGIRGEVGYGTNRINFYTVNRVTRGIINYLHKKSNKNLVVIAYDSRHYSKEYADFIYYILIKNGINAILFKEVTPTPILSFGVRYLNASLGIVITASHNPKEYNGYKVYGSDGGQITKKVADDIFLQVSKLGYEDDIKSIREEILKDEVKKGFNYVDESLIENYMENVYNTSLNKALIRKNGDRLKVVYTPLHGAGGEYINKILNKLGFKHIYFVESQMQPNGEFPTVKYPNPEEITAFKEAISLAKEKKADIVIATDPDCDRVGVMVKGKNNEYTLLTGNQIGTLLTYYILSQLRDKGELDNNFVVVKTIVTTDIVKEICKDFNIEIEEVLTGFKYIGEKIKEYEESLSKKFLLGFEESYGYLVGDFVRDKDAVIGTALICEMALYYKGLKLNLLDVIGKIYNKYGHYKEKLLSFVLSGKNGQESIKTIMKQSLNEEYLKSIGLKDLEIINYNNGIGNLPKENVVTLVTNNGKVTIRSSGTEPKIKFYLASFGKNNNDSTEVIKEFEEFINKIMKSVHNNGD